MFVLGFKLPVQVMKDRKEMAVYEDAAIFLSFKHYSHPMFFGSIEHRGSSETSPRDWFSSYDQSKFQSSKWIPLISFDVYIKPSPV